MFDLAVSRYRGILIAALLGASVFLIGAGTASANLIFTTGVSISGTGLGAVNTLVTIHDPGGPGNQNDTESGCVSWDGSLGGSSSNFTCSPQLTPLMPSLEGGDNTALNKTYLVSDATFTTAGDLALVVNISETGQDVTVTLTDLYLSFFNGTTGALLYTFEYVGPDLNLTSGEGTGAGQSGFVFVLDPAQQLIANSLCPDLTKCIAGGGMQFANGTTNDGNDTLHLIAVTGGTQQVPEPGILSLLSIAFLGLGLQLRRRKH